MNRARNTPKFDWVAALFLKQEAERREYEAAAKQVRPEFMDYLADHEGEHLDLEELSRRFGITEETARQWASDFDRANGRGEE